MVTTVNVKLSYYDKPNSYTANLLLYDDCKIRPIYLFWPLTVQSCVGMKQTEKQHLLTCVTALKQKNSCVLLLLLLICFVLFAIVCVCGSCSVCALNVLQ